MPLNCLRTWNINVVLYNILFCKFYNLKRGTRVNGSQKTLYILGTFRHCDGRNSPVFRDEIDVSKKQRWKTKTIAIAFSVLQSRRIWRVLNLPLYPTTSVQTTFFLASRVTALKFCIFESEGDIEHSIFCGIHDWCQSVKSRQHTEHIFLLRSVATFVKAFFPWKIDGCFHVLSWSYCCTCDMQSKWTEFQSSFRRT
jgi:hypothetical protein